MDCPFKQLYNETLYGTPISLEFHSHFEKIIIFFSSLEITDRYSFPTVFMVLLGIYIIAFSLIRCKTLWLSLTVTIWILMFGVNAMFKQDPTQRLPWAPTRVNLLTIHLRREGGQGRNLPDETGLAKSFGRGEGEGRGVKREGGGGLERHLSTTTELGLQEAKRKVVLHLFCWFGEGCGAKGKWRGRGGWGRVEGEGQCGEGSARGGWGGGGRNQEKHFPVQC